MELLDVPKQNTENLTNPIVLIPKPSKYSIPAQQFNIFLKKANHPGFFKKIWPRTKNN